MSAQQRDTMRGLDSWELFTLAFKPANWPRGLNMLDMNADDADFDIPGMLGVISTTLATARERERREGLRYRWGDGGMQGHLPAARRPYTRRKQPRIRRFIDEVKACAPEELEELCIEQEHFPLPGRAGALGRTFRLWRCPYCGTRARHLYPLAKADAAERLEACLAAWQCGEAAVYADVGCRTCADLVYRSQYQRLVTPERIEQALARGPRRRKARTNYERRVLIVARDRAARDARWRRRWQAAWDAYLAWNMLCALRMQVRLARLRLVLARETEASLVERRATCRAARDELAVWRESKRQAEATFKRAKAAYEKLAAA